MKIFSVKAIASLLAFNDFDERSTEGNIKVNGLKDMVALVPPLKLVLRQSRKGRGNSLTATACTHVLPQGAQSVNDLSLRADFPFENYPAYAPLVKRFFEVLFWKLHRRDRPELQRGVRPGNFTDQEDAALAAVCRAMQTFREQTWESQMVRKRSATKKATDDRVATAAAVTAAIATARAEQADAELTQEEKQMQLDALLDGGEPEEDE